MALPAFLKPIVYLNPLTYTTAAFRYIALRMDSQPADVLLRSGISFQVGGFIITPLLSIMIIVLMCIIFFSLCVYRFNTADFSSFLLQAQAANPKILALANAGSDFSHAVAQADEVVIVPAGGIGGK